jgi:hypothetical protein
MDGLGIGHRHDTTITARSIVGHLRGFTRTTAANVLSLSKNRCHRQGLSNEHLGSDFLNIHPTRLDELTGLNFSKSNRV